MRKAFVAVTFAVLPLVPLTAQAEEGRDARVSAILDGLIAEQRVILTCSTLDPALHSSLAVSWDGLVRDVLALMESGEMSLWARAAFASAARLEELVPAGDTPFAEVRAFCDGDPQWSRRAARFEPFSRYGELRSLLGEDPP